MDARESMSAFRLGIALVFACLYAWLMFQASNGKADAGVLTAAAPVATMAVTYLLGVEFFKALRRNGRNGKNNG